MTTDKSTSDDATRSKTRLETQSKTPPEAQPASQRAGAPPRAESDASSATASGREPQDPLGEPPPSPRPQSRKGSRSGGLLAGLAFVMALFALGGAGYLYYELVYRPQPGDGAEPLAADLGAMREPLSAVDARFDTLARNQESAIEALRQRQDAAREATDSALRDALADVSQQGPPSTAEWRRAELQYLLRIANHRLLMERDVAGALRLLQAADGILQELDDFSLHDVRARLADEIAALEGVTGVDVQGLFLRLETAKRGLDTLPLRVPEYVQTQSAAAPVPPAARPGPADGAAAPATDSPLAAFRRQITELVRFRRLDEAALKPLLAPDEAVYLELNLRLMLERAQIAALRGDQLIFDESIGTASDWVREYLNTDEPPVRALLDELSAVQSVQLEGDLPDISGSLNALQDVLRNPA